jgi:hypothetical protein
MTTNNSRHGLEHGSDDALAGRRSRTNSPKMHRSPRLSAVSSAGFQVVSRSRTPAAPLDSMAYVNTCKAAHASVCLQVV